MMRTRTTFAAFALAAGLLGSQLFPARFTVSALPQDTLPASPQQQSEIAV